MDLFARYGTEDNDVYRLVEAANQYRHSGFLMSMIESAVMSGQPYLTEALIKAINYHAIVALYAEAGQYRTIPVKAGDFAPPHHLDDIPSVMKEMVQTLRDNWETWSSIGLGAYALWRINHIHPFVNGNGRTARAGCYFIICVKMGGLLPGRSTLPNLLGSEPIRSTEYVDALKHADDESRADHLEPLTNLVTQLLTVQLQTA